MRNIKKIGRFILSFLLMFVVVAFIGVIFMKQVLLNASVLNQQLEGSLYYTQIEESLSANFRTLSLETSLPEEVFVEAAMDPYGLRELARTNNEQVLNYLIDPEATYATTNNRNILVEPVTTYVENYAAEHKHPWIDGPIMGLRYPRVFFAVLSNQRTRLRPVRIAPQKNPGKLPSLPHRAQGRSRSMMRGSRSQAASCGLSESYGPGYRKHPHSGSVWDSVLFRL